MSDTRANTTVQARQPDGKRGIGPLFFWATPDISEPRANASVGRRFVIRASGWALGTPIHKWNVELIYRDSAGKQHMRRVANSFTSYFLLAHWRSEVRATVEVPAEAVSIISVRVEFQATTYSPWAYVTPVFQVLAPPVITRPGTQWTPYPTLRGTGVTGAQVDLLPLYQAGIRPPLGTGQVRDGTWSITIGSWIGQGVHEVFARQTLGGETSGFSNRVSFVVLLKPMITGVSVSVGGVPSVAGGGALVGATIEIFFVGGGGGVQLTTVQSGVTWEATATRAWAAGSYRIVARQREPLTGAYSDWSDEKIVTVAPAPPGLNNPGLVTVARPILSGSGVSGALIGIYQRGFNVPFATTVVQQSSWSVLLTRDLWSADPLILEARQTVNGMTSVSAPVSFTVLLVPVITEVTVLADGRPMVSGRGLSGATIEVFHTGGGGGVQLSATVQAQGTWSVTANSPWAVQAYEITARQVGKNPQHASWWARDIKFTVRPSKPTLSQPPHSALPSQVLTISAVHAKASHVTVSRGATVVAGTLSGTGSTRQFTPTLAWPIGAQSVSATQTVDGFVSDPSDSVTFNVVFAAPTVLYPAQYGVVDIGDSFSGQRGYVGPGSRVVLYAGNIDHEVGSAIPDADGNWTSTALSLQPGEHTLRVYVQWRGLLSTLLERRFYSRPPKPVLLEPIIPSPRQSLQISGVLAGATLKVYNVAGQVTGNVISGSRYLFTPAQDWTLGEQSVWVTQQVAGVTSNRSDDVTFFVSPLAPVINEPVDKSHQPFEVHLSGTCRVGATVYVLAIDGNILVKAQVDGNGWIARHRWQVPGEARVQVMQVVNDVDSAKSPARAFFIKPDPPSIALVANPAAPAQTLQISHVYPSAATLQMLRDDDTPIPGIFTGTGSERVFTPAQDWSFGKHTVKVFQVVNSVASDASEARVICVQPLPLTIIQPPNPADATQALTLVGVHPAVENVKVFLDGHHVPGIFTRYGETYTFVPDLDWAPGTNKVWATQVVNDTESLPSEMCVFSARPFTVQFDTPQEGGYYEQDFEMTGRCHPNALVKVLNLDGSVVGSWWAIGTLWTGIYHWIPGFKQKRVVQVVNGVESAPGPVRHFYISLAVPVVGKPAHPAESDQMLEITGLYSEAVAVRVYNKGHAVTGHMTGSGSSRQFVPAQPWPHENRITVTQQLGDIVSNPSTPVDFIARPPVPQLIDPAEGEYYPLKFELSGTGVSDATVVLLDTDGERIASWPVQGGQWYGIHTWSAPGFKHKQLMQVRQGIESRPGPVRGFYLRPDRVEILPPTNPAMPAQALTVRHVGSGNVLLAMFDENDQSVPGVFSEEGSIRQFIASKNWAKVNQVYAVQTVNDVMSEPSEMCRFDVRIQAPIIEYPQHDQVIDIGAILSGSRGWPGIGASVVVSDPLTGVEVAHAVPLPDGHWTAHEALPHGPGVHEIVVRVYLQDLVSEEAHRTFRVRPPRLAIVPLAETNNLRQTLLITGVYSAGATLNLVDENGHQVSGTFVIGDKEAVFSPDQDWPYDANKVTANQVVGGVASVVSEPCVFIVIREPVPDAPYFELPLAGSQSSSRPLIRIKGLPGALVSLRGEGELVLHGQVTEEDGTLEFVIEEPFKPGPVALQAKQQKGTGPQSPWSEPHTFHVMPRPQTPEIRTPTHNSRVSRKPQFTGTGVTGGQLLLRHVNDLSNVLATIPGVRSWRWSASADWALGRHGVQVQQAVDGDTSEWSAVREFEVVDARYLIDKISPVSAQPVVRKDEGALLRFQVLNAETEEGQAGLQVRWVVDGEEALWSITTTDRFGWAEYLYRPQTEGVHQVIADMTGENEGVVTQVGFTVTALEDNPWDQHFVLYLNQKPVDLAFAGLQLRRGRRYVLELEVNEDSPLLGSTVTLEDFAGAQALGLVFSPPLGEPRSVDGQSVSWSVTSLLGDEGHFGLKLMSPSLPDWYLQGKLLSDDLGDLVEVRLDAFRGKSFGEPLLLCRGATHTILVVPEADTEIIGKEVTLDWLPDAADHGMILQPVGHTARVMEQAGLTWTVDCSEASADVNAGLEMKVAAWDVTSRVLPIGLAHNKGTVSETYGPVQMGGTAQYYYKGMRVASAFTGEILPSFPVILTKDGVVYHQKTSRDGWVYTSYYSGQSASLSVNSPYDQQ